MRFSRRKRFPPTAAARAWALPTMSAPSCTALTQIFSDDKILYEDYNALEKAEEAEQLCLIDGEFPVYNVKLVTNE